MSTDIRQGFFTSADGTRLAMYSAGPARAPTLVLSNGLGGNITTWRHLIAHFTPAFRVVSWDYRGLFASEPPAEDSQAAYSMEKQCEDMHALLTAARVTRPVFIGWSMGVQVNFEYLRRHPRKFRGLVVINGTYGRPFSTALRSHWMDMLGPRFLDLLEYIGPLMHAAGPLLTRSRAVVAFAKAAGLASPTLDEDVFLDLAKEWVELDFTAYARNFRTIAEHNAGDVLGHVKVPTLVITGEKDLFTPMGLSREMVAKIHGAEFMAVKGGTHYTPIEYPMIVNRRIEKFLRERLGLG